MTLPDGRILLPDRIKDMTIAPKWERFDPIFCVSPVTGWINIINNEYPEAASAGAPSIDFGVAGRKFSGDGTANTGLVYDRDPYNCGDDYTIFVVSDATQTPGIYHTFVANGLNSGTKPFNFRLQQHSTTRDISFAHDTGPSEIRHRYSMSTVMSNSAPSTVSAAVNGTLLHKQIDGEYGTYTMSVAPVDAVSGSMRIMSSQGTSTGFNGDLYLVVVFNKFIHNELLFELHSDPMKLFKRRVITIGKAPVGAPATNPKGPMGMPLFRPIRGPL